MRDRDHAGGAIHRGTEIVAIALLRLTGVEPRAHQQRTRRPPRLRSQSALRLHRGAQRICSRPEHRMEAVAPHLDHMTAVRRIALPMISS